MTNLSAENIRAWLAHLLCVSKKISKIYIRKKKKKKAFGNWTQLKMALSIKCPVVLVTDEKAMGESQKFLWVL